MIVFLRFSLYLWIRYTTICNTLSLGPSASTGRQIWWMVKLPNRVCSPSSFHGSHCLHHLYNIKLNSGKVAWCLAAKLCRDDFVHYASTCFKEFGDRVKHWITFNEPHNFAIEGYDLGIQAPGRCSILSHMFCREGASSTEPYVVAHNILLAHAGAFHTYKQHFKVNLL